MIFFLIFTKPNENSLLPRLRLLVFVACELRCWTRILFHVSLLAHKPQKLQVAQSALAKTASKRHCLGKKLGSVQCVEEWPGCWHTIFAHFYSFSEKSDFEKLYMSWMVTKAFYVWSIILLLLLSANMKL